jgi:acetyl-CoA acetyltransferase family protein
MKLEDTTLGWRFINPKLSAMHHPYSMGETAENVAEKYHISRADQDAFALRSQQRAVAAQQAGRFASEIIPVTIPQKKGEPTIVALDEHPRADTTLQKLAALKPVFRKDGTVTAGNAAGINDGAAALVLMAQSRAQQLGRHARARIVASAVAGVDPAYMGLGPIPATRKALQRARLSIKDIDLVELNEAFASQSLQCMRELEIDEDKLNVNGGAIALGHPLGCSGARLVVTLLHELERRGGRYGLATMCIGVGQGIATIIERI